MEIDQQKMKIITAGLAGILLISLIINLQTFGAKQALLRERDILTKDNLSLKGQVEQAFKEKRRLDEQVNSLNADLARISKDKEEIQGKFDLANKEKEGLVAKIQKMESQLRVATVASKSEGGPVSEDNYWASVVKAKKELELQLQDIDEKLKLAELNNGQLQKEKGALELDIGSLNGDRDDLKAQLEYNKKLMDRLAQDLVIERNDKFQIQDTLKAVRNENKLLRRQLSSLNNRKVEVERKLTALEKEKIELEDKLGNTDALLKDHLLQIGNLKRRLEKTQGAGGVSEAVAEGGATKEEAVELPPIVVRPQQSEDNEGPLPLVGKVLSVNKENNFVIVNLGEDSGVKIGDTFQIYRKDMVVANVEAIKVRQDITACDIKKEIEPIKVGDIVR